MLARVGRAGVGVEHDQRNVVGTPIADRDDLPDQRVLAFDGVLDVGRGHVLSGGVDDQFFFAVDDPHVSVFVDLGDVAGVQPPVRAEHLTGAFGVAVVPGHHQRAAHQQLPVLSDAQLHPAQRVPQLPIRTPPAGWR